MLRIGRMIRSAKMNDTTPPKLIPPFHSTAARARCRSSRRSDHRHYRADQRAPDPGKDRVVGEEKALPEAYRYPGGERAGGEQPADDVAPDRGPLHHEDVRHGGET